MEDKKYCPLFTMAAALIKVESAQSCMEKHCAWYDNPEHRCALVSLADNINGIAAEIANK